MDAKEVKRYAVIIFLIVLAYLSYLVLKPFFTVIIGALILAYLFYPLHKKLTKLIKNKTLSGILVTIILLLLIIIPTVFITISIVKESVILYNSGIIEKTTEKINQITAEKDQTIKNFVDNILKSALATISNSASKLIVSVPSSLFGLLILLYLFFYALTNGQALHDFIKDNLDIKKKDKIFEILGKATHDIIYGLFLIALIETLIAGITFKLLGIPNVMLLSIITFIVAFLPFIGPSVVYVPLAIYKLVYGNYISAIILIVVGLCISAIETFGRPKIIGDKTSVNPAIVLMGILGGLYMFGIVGMIIGPLILTLLFTAIEIYFAEQ